MSANVNGTDLIAGAMAAQAIVGANGRPMTPSSGVSIQSLLAAGVNPEWMELQMGLGRKLVELPQLWRELQGKSANTVAGNAVSSPKPESKRVYIPAKVVDHGPETPEQELARLRAENERLKAIKATPNKLSMKVSDKGGLSVYGLGRFPVTLYRGQWERLLDSKTVEQIIGFIIENEGSLAVKE